MERLAPGHAGLPSLTPPRRTGLAASAALLAIVLAGTGCASPYRADRGALVGGLGGAGVGALVGSAVGKTLPGAAIGAGVGALTGGIVGGELDEIEARNQAEISRQIGQAMPSGTVSVQDVIDMTRAEVDPDVIAAHVRQNGFAGPLNAQDLIFLKDQGVDPRVVQAMQSGPRPRYPGPTAPPVVVQEHYYGGPYCGPYWYPPPPRYCRPRGGFGWGVSVSNGW